MHGPPVFRHLYPHIVYPGIHVGESGKKFDPRSEIDSVRYRPPVSECQFESGISSDRKVRDVVELGLPGILHKLEKFVWNVRSHVRLDVGIEAEETVLAPYSQGEE